MSRTLIRWICVLMVCVSLNAEVIDFDDLPGKHGDPIVFDSYRAHGVIFERVDGGNAALWNASGWPTVQDDPFGGAWSWPNGVMGNFADVGVRAKFVVPCSDTPTTVDYVGVYFLSGPGFDGLTPGIALVAHDIFGDELGHVVVDSNLQFEFLEISTNGIASVTMEAGSSLDVFDEFTFSGLSGLYGDCDCNGIVGTGDFEQWWEDCVFGPDNSQPSDCGCTDFDGDGDGDLRDFAGLQLQFTNPLP